MHIITRSYVSYVTLAVCCTVYFTVIQLTVTQLCSMRLVSRTTSYLGCLLIIFDLGNESSVRGELCMLSMHSILAKNITEDNQYRTCYYTLTHLGIEE